MGWIDFDIHKHCRYYYYIILFDNIPILMLESLHRESRTETVVVTFYTIIMDIIKCIIATVCRMSKELLFAAVMQYNTPL